MANDVDLGFMEHLAELRKRILLSLGFFVITLTIALFFVPQIMAFIKLTSGGSTVDLNIFNVTDSLYLYMRLASLIGFILTMPFLLFQFWLFIKPGLEKREIRFARRYFPVMLLLFFSGIAFAYFVIIPYYVVFASNLASANGLETVIGARLYIDFIVKTVWPFGLAFEMPVIIHVLSSVGLLNHKVLTVFRGYAYIGLMLISAFLTPPDPVSMGIMLVPLSLLYESSVWIAKKNQKKRLQVEKAL